MVIFNILRLIDRKIFRNVIKYVIHSKLSRRHNEGKYAQPHAYIQKSHQPKLW